ncbi:MAG: hypothetical protein LBK70_00050 [Clostridiales bacterium]|jgi:fumarate reductase subunit D|nr:hypothetical protein [Clostridiales bacterium]
MYNDNRKPTKLVGKRITVVAISLCLILLGTLVVHVAWGNRSDAGLADVRNTNNVNYMQYKASIQQELDIAKHGISAAEQQQIQMIEDKFLLGYFDLLDGNVTGEQLMEYISNNINILVTFANIGDSVVGTASRAHSSNYGFLGLGIRIYLSHSEAVRLANLCYGLAAIGTIVSIFPVLAPVSVPFAAMMGIFGSLISNNITDKGVELDFYALVFCGVRGR